MAACAMCHTFTGYEMPSDVVIVSTVIIATGDAMPHSPDEIRSTHFTPHRNSPPASHFEEYERSRQGKETA